MRCRFFGAGAPARLLLRWSGDAHFARPGKERTMTSTSVRMATMLGWTCLAVLGAACGQTPADDSAVPGGKTAATHGLVFDARTEPPGSHCPAGGIALLSGPDRNRNDVLDPGEVTG